MIKKKRKSSHPSLYTDKVANKRYSEDGIADTHLFSLDNPSDISFEDPSYEPPEATNLLEPLTKLTKNLKEDSSANQMPAQLDITSSHSPLYTDKTAKKRYPEDGIADTHRFSLDNPSDISFEDPSYEPPEATNLLEPLIKFIQNLKEDSSANQMPAQLDITSYQTDTNRETNEEAQWRLQIAKDNLTMITYSRKTCSKCPSCNQLFLSRKQAILHFQTSHTQDNASHVKFPRIPLHRNGLCFKCNSNQPSNLITLSCSTQLCETCLLDMIHCNECEGLDHVWYFHFHIHCSFCHKPHRIDPDAATFFYELCELPIPILEGCPHQSEKTAGNRTITYIFYLGQCNTAV